MRVIVVILGVAMVSGTAAAQPTRSTKPKLAVLGLEPKSQDPGDAAIADDLTDRMRVVAVKGLTSYVLAPGADRSLAEMKKLVGCPSDSPQCLASIGANLAADRVLYGRVERRGNGHQVSVMLFDVVKKRVVRSSVDLLPPALSPSGIDRFARNMFRRATSDHTTGILKVTADAIDAIVAIDGEHEVALEGHTAKLALPPGTYAISVTAGGRRPHEQSVAIVSGDEVVLDLRLEKLPKTKLSCDDAPAIARGDAHARAGRHAAALGAFENALACRADAATFAKAFASACHGRNAKMARVLYRRIGDADRRRLVPLCRRNAIDVTGRAKD
jgi:hypothetical protein